MIEWEQKQVATGFGTREYKEILHATPKMDAPTRQHGAIMDCYDPEKKLALAVDEWGAWYAPANGSNPGFPQQQNSLRDGLLASLNLNIFARHAERVRIANIAQMVNVLQAMILTEDARLLLTPTYHVVRMYVPFQNARVLPPQIEAGTWSEANLTLPRVDAIAAHAEDDCAESSVPASDGEQRMRRNDIAPYFLAPVFHKTCRSIQYACCS